MLLLYCLQVVISHSQHTLITNMVLSKPNNKHVMKAFDLTGKVAAITGKFASLVASSADLVQVALEGSV